MPSLTTRARHRSRRHEDDEHERDDFLQPDEELHLQRQRHVSAGLNALALVRATNT